MSLGAGHAETKIGELAAQGNATAKAFRRILNDCRVYHFHDTSAVGSDSPVLLHQRQSVVDADAGTSLPCCTLTVSEFPMVYDRIVSTMRKMLPEFGDFELGPSRLNPNDIILDWRKQGFDYLFGPHQLSDGTHPSGGDMYAVPATGGIFCPMSSYLTSRSWVCIPTL